MVEKDRKIFEKLVKAVDATVVDPRREHPSKLYCLLDIVVLVVLGTLCGGKSYEDIVQWGEASEPWLREFLVLEYGVPSEGVLRGVMERLDPVDVEDFFKEVTTHMAQVRESLINIDGKVVKKALAGAGSDQQLCVLSAWAHDNGLVLAQERVKEGDNELTTLPALLKKLPLEGATVTIDAIGTQTALAQDLRERGADYMFIAKDNQPTLHKEIRDFFDWQLGLPKVNEDRVSLGYDEQWDKGHGRVEMRSVHAYSGPLIEGRTGLTRLQDFTDAKTILRVERQRHIGDEVSREVRYYFTSQSGDSDDDAARFNTIIRSHWAVENNAHWLLDVCFGEDQRRLSKTRAAYNFSILRRLALNLVRNETSLGKRVPLRTRMFRASFDRSYLAKVLAVALNPDVHDS